MAVCLLSLVLVAVALGFSTGSDAQQCSSDSDIGTVNCVYIPRYTPNWQWATCLTDAYIRRVSKQRGLSHQCIDITAVRCWYQCQLEVHNTNYGALEKDCQCSSNASTPMPQCRLPSECSSPSGTDCSWYRNCLDQCHPCGADGYALGFGEKFCNLYSREQAAFSPSGQLWIDHVRKCLQVKLVPFLRPFEKATCENIRSKAFASHTPCYTESKPSVCSLTCSDISNIFFLVFPNTPKAAALDVIRQTRDTFIECFPSTTEKANRLQCLRGLGMAMASTIVFVKNLPTLIRDKIADIKSALWSAITETLSSTVSKLLNWREKGLDWIMIPEAVQLSSESSIGRQRRDTANEITANLTIQLFIADRSVINTTYVANPNVTTALDVSAKAVRELAETVRTSPQLQNIAIDFNGSLILAAARAFSQCLNLQCNVTDPDITDIAPLPGLGDRISAGRVCSSMFLFTFLLLLFAQLMLA